MNDEATRKKSAANEFNSRVNSKGWPVVADDFRMPPQE